jgi:hypothetical protein
MKIFHRVVFLAAFLLLVPADSSYAWQTSPAALSGTLNAVSAATSKSPDPGAAGFTDSFASSLIKEEPDISDSSDIYLKTTVQNLSKLYWALGMMDIKDDELIEQYLFINECETYSKYLHNDFEWTKIKQATRKMLGKNMAVFPTRYEIMQPISVGRYDQEKQQFELLPNSVMNNVKRLDVSPNLGVPICRTNDDIKNYPRNLILVLLRPFTLKTIPVSPELAELYISSTQLEYVNVPSSISIYSYKREAFLRLKVRFVQYLETIDYRGTWRAVVVGSLEGYEIFADREKTKLLYANSDLSKTVRKKRHHRTDDDPALSAMKAASNPNGVNAPTLIPGDSTTGDNTSETDDGEGLTGTGIDPGGMGTSENTDSDTIITPGTP